jgi:signal recognition particle receptor subunit beta
MLVVRLVYDGPPRSGKTTSLRALAGSLSRPHLSQEEAEGRTLYFDWVEYIGGTFEGRPIRCQIVSVPGQRALARRREELLTSADAVIFVTDTTGAGIAEAAESMSSLHTFLAGRPGPRPGLIVQANKRDQPDALPLDTLRARLACNGTAVIESVATEGVGIRETFVFAVRLALDRVRERLAAGIREEDLARADTPEGLRARLEATGADTLLEEIEGISRAARDEPPAAALLREVLAGEDAPRAGISGSAAEAGGTGTPEPARPPRLPGSDLPSGRVWPPVSGRLLLHEVPAGQPVQGADGSWRAHLGSFYFHSAREHEFPELAAGHQELLRWARLHGDAAGRLSPRRCIVLADTGRPGAWRLWQLVQHEPSLRQQLWGAVSGGDPAAIAGTLLECAADLLAAREDLVREPPLPCRLELLGRASSSLVYVGILPPPSWTPAAGELEADAATLLRRELLPVLQKGLASAGLDVPGVLTVLDAARTQTADPVRASLVEMLSALLRGPVQRS